MYLSNFHFKILQSLRDDDYQSGTLAAHASGDETRFIETLRHLYDLHLVFCCPDSTKEQYLQNKAFWDKKPCHFDPSYHFLLTDLGHYYLDLHNSKQRDRELFEMQVASLTSIAEDARSQASTAIEDLQFAKDQAAKAEKDSKIATAISIISIVSSAIIPLIIHLTS